MKMNKELEDAFNKQILFELESWYIYLGLASWYSGKGLHGFAHWMHVQADEELVHARKLRDYLILRFHEPKYSPIGVNIKEFSGKYPIDGMKESLKHEQFITKTIHELVELAQKHRDHGAVLFLQWFVSEQEEEESSVQDVVDNLAIVGDSHSGLFSIDKTLMERTLD